MTMVPQPRYRVRTAECFWKRGRYPLFEKKARLSKGNSRRLRELLGVRCVLTMHAFLQSEREVSPWHSQSSAAARLF